MTQPAHGWRSHCTLVALSGLAPALFHSALGALPSGRPSDHRLAWRGTRWRLCMPRPGRGLVPVPLPLAGLPGATLSRA